MQIFCRQCLGSRPQLFLQRFITTPGAAPGNPAIGKVLTGQACQMRVGGNMTLGGRPLSDTLHKWTSQNTYYIHQGTSIAAKIGFNNTRVQCIHGNLGLGPAITVTAFTSTGSLR